MSKIETNYSLLAVPENEDLLRVIGEYLIGTQLPFVLSSKTVRDALRPLAHVRGVKWIISKKKYFVTSVSMVAWAESLGCEFNVTRSYKNLFTYAATNGSVDVLRWAHHKYPPNQFLVGVSSNVCVEAAKNGHLPILEYLRSLGNIVKWDELVCIYAAEEGHIHILQWLREILDPPCPWDHYTCSTAAFNGHLYILQWLRAQDPPCPWSEWSCFCAAQEGFLDMLKWLRSQDPPCPWWKQRCIDQAGNNNHHEIAEWILSQPD